MIRRQTRARLEWLSLATMMLMYQAAHADEARSCSTMADDRARLACYDSIFGRPPAAAPASAPAAVGTAAAAPAAVTPAAVAPGAAAPVAAAPAAVAAADPQTDFGLTEAAKRAREPAESAERHPDSISGTVARVSRQPAGEFVVTLENGQVWTQLQVDTRARVAVGDTVTIKKAALGSHLLVTTSRYATRVRRVK